MKKSDLFYFDNNLTKNQLVSLKSYLKCFVKKQIKNSVEKIFDNFLEEIQYSFEINDSRYIWLKNYIDDDVFRCNIKKIIRYNLKYENYKQNQKNYIKISKEQIKKYRQSKEKPTKKQINYYNSLCKKNRINKEDLKNKSKLDLIEMISDIINNT